MKQLFLLIIVCILAATVFAQTQNENKEPQGGTPLIASVNIRSVNDTATDISGTYINENIQSMPVDIAAVASLDPVDDFITAQKALLDKPEAEYRPGTRWWMAEGLHTDQTIINGVKELHDMGIGAIEIVCMPEVNVSGSGNPAGAPHIPADLDVSKWPQGTTAKEVYSWGSEEWRHDTELLITEAAKYGMIFSMTSGTHWANANLPEAQLTPDDDGAGKSLGYTIQPFEVVNGTKFDGTLLRSIKSGYGVNRQDLVAVVAYQRDVAASNATISQTGNNVNALIVSADSFMVYKGDPIILTDRVKLNGVSVTAATMQDPTGAANFTLEWDPVADDGLAAGTYDIYTFWLQATGQSPTPSATRNFTINYIDPYGMKKFINYYDTEIFIGAFRNIIQASGLGELYMDSMEISCNNGTTQQFWGYTLLAEFLARRGYDLTPYLPLVIKNSGVRSINYPVKLSDSNGAEMSVMMNKIRNDLYQTMTELYLDNILFPLKKYLNEVMNMKLRAETSYCVVYEISTTAIGVDHVETESYEFGSQIDGFRNMSGAAHVYGKRLSSEMGAGFANYVQPQLKFMQAINRGFASGISHTVFHGYSSIQGADDYDTGTTLHKGTYWPGHEGMYARHSDRWGPRQPAFRFYDDYMPMLARAQKFHQMGKPQIDIAILRTNYLFDWLPYQGRNEATGDFMQYGRALYLKDLSLQNAGYTYDYFAPENLEVLKAEKVELYSASKGLIPGNVGYQGVIIYQEDMRVESAVILLELAKQGLPIIFVNGLTENLWVGRTKTHKKAAVYSLSLSKSDADLAVIIDEIKKLPNVIEIDANISTANTTAANYERDYVTGKTNILATLQSIGLNPRAKFGQSNEDFLTFIRRTDNELYLYVYNYTSKLDYYDRAVNVADAATVSISIDAVGKPYLYDPWSTEMSEVAEYRIENGRTVLDVTLETSATVYFILNLNDNGEGLHAVSTDADKVTLANGSIAVCATESGTYTTELSNGAKLVSAIEAPANVNLSTWNLMVEDWNAGDKKYIYEDRGKGYKTTEVYFETKKTNINVGPTSLISWRNIPAVGPTVSGLGFYTTEFTLPNDWSAQNGAYLKISSVGGDPAAVYVNGMKAKAFDFIAGHVDVSELLRPGANKILVEVSTTLGNRLIERNYEFGNNFGAGIIRDYGMVGNATLVTYTKVALPVNR